MNYLRFLWLAIGVLLFCCCTSTVIAVSDVSAASIDDEPLADFAFDTVAKDAQQQTAERRADLDTLADIDIDDADDADVGVVQSGRRQNAFAIKEQRIRLALQRATKEVSFTRKFAQILPIMRSLNAQQRLVLASLITAQSTADAGKSLDLKQVESMFGERRSLILPILFDIANLIKTAAVAPATGARHARTLLEDIARVPAAELLRHSYIPLQQSGAVTRPPIADNVTAPVAAMLRDDRLHVDDTDDVLTTRNLVVHASHHEERRSLAGADATTMRSRSNDQRSYHERKLNMTNFNASTGDQYAMESEGVPIRITLPRSPMSRPNDVPHFQPQSQQQMVPQSMPQTSDSVQQPQLTLEEYEDLALRDLNDTIVSATSLSSTDEDDAHSPAPQQMVRNETTGELLPLPEMLISRYRNKNNPNRKLLAAGSNGLESSVAAARHCERFGSLCLRVEDYPMQAIMGSIRRHKHAMSALLAEYIDKDDIASTKALNDEAKRREDDELTPSGMCPSVIRYARPQKARSATGEWKYIVNTGQHTQTLRLEKCTKVEESCTYLTDNFRSRCVQVFNYHRLLSWDNARGLHIDIFKVPTCCSCHIDSYKEKFPPILTSYNGLQDDYRYSASNIQPLQQQTQPSTYQHHRHHTSPYTTILSDPEPQLDDTSAAGTDDDESIAYQYSNGFKRSPGKQHHKYRDSTVGATSNKPVRFEKPHKSVSPQHTFAAVSPTLDSYLTPPTSESEFDFVSPFKRGGTAGTAFVGDAVLPDIGSVSSTSSQQHQQQRNRNRRPVRTNNRDQTIAGSDFLPDHSVLPSHTDPHHPSPVNTAYASATGGGHSPASIAVHNRQQQQQSVTSATIPGVASVTSTSIAHGQHPPLLTTPHLQPHHQLPSISTASTSAVDLGKRVNYNYHPIIDFFGDAMRSDQQQKQLEIEDRVGVGGGGDQRTWRPSHGPPLGVNGRRVHRP